MSCFDPHRKYPPHAHMRWGFNASSTGTRLLSLSTIVDAKISNPPWVNFQSAGWVSFQSAPTQNLYCSSGHPFFLRSDQNLTFEELSAADYVDRGYVAENKRPCELRFASAVSAFSMEAIALLILSDTYIGYLPTHYAASWVERGRLRTIMPQRLGYRSAFHCITRQGVEKKGTVSGFLDALTAHAELHL